MTNQARIEVRHEGKAKIVELLDEEILDEITISEIAESLFSVLEEGSANQMVLSFARVKHLSSMALGTLIRLNKRAEEHGGKLKLCEIRKNLYEIFEITKLNKLFDIYESRDLAISSFG
ncbi:MAG: STAS domain-containing protein [Sedimentisphaerales bacterium]|nr:STAS domain-containing protein [Sedimentisphaerales bacterium]